MAKKSTKKKQKINGAQIGFVVVVVLFIAIIATIATLIGLQTDGFTTWDFSAGANTDDVVVPDTPQEPTEPEIEYKMTDMGFYNSADTVYLNLSPKRLTQVNTEAKQTGYKGIALVCIESESVSSIDGFSGYPYFMTWQDNQLLLSPASDEPDVLASYPEDMRFYGTLYSTNTPQIESKDGWKKVASKGYNSKFLGENCELLNPITGKPAKVSLIPFSFINAIDTNFFSYTPVVKFDDIKNNVIEGTEIVSNQLKINSTSFYVNPDLVLEDVVDLSKNRCVAASADGYGIFVQDGALIYAHSTLLSSTLSGGAIDFENTTEVLYSTTTQNITYAGVTFSAKAGWNNLLDKAKLNFSNRQFFWIADDFKQIFSASAIDENYTYLEEVSLQSTSVLNSLKVNSSILNNAYDFAANAYAGFEDIRNNGRINLLILNQNTTIYLAVSENSVDRYNVVLMLEQDDVQIELGYKQNYYDDGEVYDSNWNGVSYGNTDQYVIPITQNYSQAFTSLNFDNVSFEIQQYNGLDIQSFVYNNFTALVVK